MPRVPRFLSLLLAFGTALAQPAHAFQGDPMPTTLTRSTFDRPYPLFVAADSALDGLGRPRPEYFQGETFAAIEALLTNQNPPGDSTCLEYGAVVDAVARGDDRSTFRNALKSSPVVFFARVSGSIAGFEYGVPGQLLRLEIENVLKGGAYAGTYYYFVPIARFRIAHLDICKVDDRFPAPPEVGDRVLMMLARRDSCEEPYIDSHDAFEGSQIIVIPISGLVRAGKDLRAELPRLGGMRFEDWVLEQASEETK